MSAVHESTIATVGERSASIPTALFVVLANQAILVTVYRAMMLMNARLAFTTATHLQYVQTPPVHSYALATLATLATDCYAPTLTNVPPQATTVT